MKNFKDFHLLLITFLLLGITHIPLISFKILKLSESFRAKSIASEYYLCGFYDSIFITSSALATLSFILIFTCWKGKLKWEKTWLIINCLFLIAVSFLSLIAAGFCAG